MVEWLFKPKVQLGLLLNFAFITFTLVSSFAGPQPPNGRWRPVAVDVTPSVPYAPLPPSATLSSAAFVESGGYLNIFLNNDLTLVRKTGRTLVLSPSIGVRVRPAPELPTTVTLRFIVFSTKEACPGACMLVVNADGSRVLESAANGTFSAGWKRDKIPGSTTTLSDGQVIETLATETFTTQIPYATFLEIINARRVVLSFGPDKVELTHDQIEAMRDMQRQIAPMPTDGDRDSKIIKSF